jgi:hypothetical protein
MLIDENKSRSGLVSGLDQCHEQHEAGHGRKRITMAIRQKFAAMFALLPPTLRQKRLPKSVSQSIDYWQRQSRLLSLPPELRTKIYEHVLRVDPEHDHETGLEVTILQDQSCIWDVPVPRRRGEVTYRPPNSVLEIIRTCQLVRFEAEQIFYRVNSLKYSMYYQQDKISCWSPLTVLQKPRLEAIGDLTVTADDRPLLLLELERKIDQLPNLRVLHFWVRQIQAVDGKYFPDEFFLRIVGVLRRAINLREASLVGPSPGTERFIFWQEQYRGQNNPTNLPFDRQRQMFNEKLRNELQLPEPDNS